MVGVPRSQNLMAWTSPDVGGVSPVWQTPDGNVTLVKSIHAYNAALIEQSLDIIVARPAGTAAYIVRQSMPSGTLFEWNGWVVLNPQDYIYVQVAAGPMVVWISGAVLLGPPPFPPAARDLATVLPAEPLLPK